MSNPFATLKLAGAVLPPTQSDAPPPTPGGPPYRAISAFSGEQQAFIRHLAETGEIALADRDGVPHVSYWSLEAYMVGTDPGDWYADWDKRSA